MTIRASWAIAALLIGLIVGLIALAPAAKVIALTGLDQNPEFRIHEPSGRILRGSVQTLQVGSAALNDLRWSAHPLTLLAGKLAADIELSIQNSIRAQGLAKASFGGVITLVDWNTALTLEQLKPILKLPFLPVDAQADIRLDEVRIGSNQRPEFAQGQIAIHELQWALVKPAAALGDFIIEIDTRDDGIIVGTVSDQQAKLGVEGTVELLPDGTYNAKLSIAPRPETPAMIRNTLPTLGRPNKDGSYPLTQKGRIPGW